jgi:hypothetical protein
VTPSLADCGLLVAASVAALSSGRIIAGLARRRPVTWDTELLHLAMGAAMLGMLDGRIALLPSLLWLASFAAGGVWFVCKTALLALRQVSLQVVGSGLVHVGGCSAMIFMCVAAPTTGSTSMPAMADLICGARMLGMRTSETAVSIPAPLIATLAVTLGAVLVAGAICLGRTLSLASATARDGATADVIAPTSAPVGLPQRTLARLGAWVQIAMCLTMAAMLVALYR